MSYIDDICNPLIKTLDRTLSLPAHQFAGHAANLDFWMDEVVHCLQVIDGYNQRFERMRDAQQEFSQTNLPDESNHPVSEVPLQRGIKDSARKELRRKLCQTAHSFGTRCENEKLLELEEAQTYKKKMQ